MLLCLAGAALASAAVLTFAAEGWLGGSPAVLLAGPTDGPSRPEHQRTTEQPLPHRVLAPLVGDAADLGAPPSPGSSRLAGSVRGTDGEGISDAVVTLMTADGIPVGAPSTVGPTGDFEWTGLPRRLFRVQAIARNVQGEVLVAAPDDAVQLCLPLRDDEPLVAVAVQVLDQLGAPVAGAVVEAIGAFSPPGPRRGIADADGLCRFAGSPCSSAVILARTADGRLGCHLGAPAGPAVAHVTVGVPGTMGGTVRTPGSVSLPSGAAIVALLGEMSPLRRGHAFRFSAPIVGDTYRFDALPAGAYTLCVTGVGDSGLLACPDSTSEPVSSAPAEWPAPVRATVTAETSTRCDLHLVIASAVEGEVRDERGSPLANVTVECERPLSSWRPRHEAWVDGRPVEPATTPSGELHPAHGNATTTDGSGRYRLSGLVPGLHRISARVAGHVAAEQRARLVPSSRPRRLDFVLAKAGAVEGTVGHGAVVILHAEDASATRARETDARGLFRFADVAPGRYELKVVESHTLVRRPTTDDAATPTLATVVVGRPRRGAPVHAVPCLRSALAPAEFALDDDAGEAVEGVTDATGRVTLRGVRSGDVVVRVAPAFTGSESYAGHRFRLAFGRSVDVRLTPR